MREDERPAGELVWVSIEEVRQGVVRQPCFSEDIRADIHRIQLAFGEFIQSSFEAWELGFRRDINPTQEITIWLHAACIYCALAEREMNAVRRRDIYTCIIACMAFKPEVVRQLVHPVVLSAAEVEEVLRSFFRKAS